MNVYILGICGTFMAGVAAIAKQKGYQVSGCDDNVYPPMSTQLQEQGVELQQGYNVDALPEGVDCYIIGNAMQRGNPLVEHILDKGLPYQSAPQWLYEKVLYDKWVLAITGTHGKTTTSGMLAWILEEAGLQPGFLIGGVPENFGVSARLGDSSFFVIEADEYDTAFFDKRSKFVHYHPRTLVLNNLEYDHADIFPDLDAIKRQFHHLIRTVPASGRLIYKGNEPYLHEVLDMGCWSETETFAVSDPQWHASNITQAGEEFAVNLFGDVQGKVNWSLLGKHNIENALAVIAAARHVGVEPKQAIAALQTYKNVKRRMQVVGEINGVTIYDDFAHHPTAIACTLEALRDKVGQDRIFAVLECASYTMRKGLHGNAVITALAEADDVYIKKPQDDALAKLLDNQDDNMLVMNDTQNIIDSLIVNAKSGDHILIMSNRGFDNIYERLLEGLTQHV